MGIETSPNDTVAEPIACAGMLSRIANGSHGEAEEEPRRAAVGLPPEALSRYHDGAFRGRRAFERRPALRRPQARGEAPPLRPAPRDGRRPSLVGRSEGAVLRPGREAPRGRDGRPPSPLRRLRGLDSRR